MKLFKAVAQSEPIALQPDFGAQDLGRLCDVFEDVEKLLGIIGSKVRDTPLEFHMQQRLLGHMEKARNEIDTCKYLCIRNKLTAIFLG